MTRHIARTFLIGTVAWAAAAFAEPPSVKLVTAPLVSPASAWSFYGSSTTHTVGAAAPTSPPSEVTELARALGAGRYTAGNYALAVYEYIRNNIQMDFRFGSSKGARGAVIDQSGTAFDQASLMVALLRANGISATYQVGTISLTAAQFQAWTGLADPASGLVNAVTACQYLADGAIPATVNGATSCAGLSGTLATTGTPVTLAHIWVMANGVIYDPAYKIHVVKAGVDLAAQMGCGNASAPTCGSTILGYVPATQTLAGSVPYVANVNQSGLEAQLAGYAVNLQHYIQTTNTANTSGPNPNLQVEDLIGGTLIDVSQSLPAPTGNPVSELPSSAYSAAQFSWGGDVPDQYRTRLTIQFDNINQAVFADETAGNRLRIWGVATNETTTSATRNLTLYSEYRPLATSSVAGATGGVGVPLVLTVQHPYAANSGTYGSEALTFNVGIQTNSCYFPPYSTCSLSNSWGIGVVTILQGWGTSTESTVSHYAELARRDVTNTTPENPTDPKHIWIRWVGNARSLAYTCTPVTTPTGPVSDTECYENHQGTLGASWLAQSTRAMTLVGQVNGVAVQHHHSLGTLLSGASYDGGPNTGSTALNIQSSVSGNARNGTASDRGAAFYGVTATIASLEGSVSEQLADSSLGEDSLSMIQLANNFGTKLLQVNAANYSVAAGQLNGFPAWVLTDIQSYVNAGYTLILPQLSATGTLSLGQTSLLIYFNGYAAYGPNGDRVAYIVAGADKGAAGAGADDMEAAVESSIKSVDYSRKGRQRFSVNPANGELNLVATPDLVTGVGDFPYSLSYQRVFSPANVAWARRLSLVPYLPGSPSYGDPETGVQRLSLGSSGWTHTFGIYAKFSSDGMAGLGRDSALNASAAIAALYVQRTLNTGTQDIRSNLATIFTTHWLGQSFWNNEVTVTRPPKNTAFVKLPDQTYNPEPGSAEKLVQAGSRVPFMYGDGGNIQYDASGVTFSLTDKDGSVMAMGYRGLVSPYSNPIENHFMPSTWTFPSGVVVTFSYDQYNFLTGVANSLGRSLTFLDQDVSGGGSGTLATDDSNRTVQYSIPAGNFPATVSFTTPDGAVTTYNYVANPQTAINRQYYRISQWITPTSSAPYITVGYDSFYRVNSVADNSSPQNTTQYFVTGLYGRENQKRGEIMEPLGSFASNPLTTKYFDLNGSEVQSIDPLGRVTSSVFDTHHRRIKIVHPELNSDTFTYDVRSNPLSVTHNPKPGALLAATVSYKSYKEGPTVANCVHPASCNKVSSEQDANTNVSSYGWNDTTGLPTSITSPAISTGTPQRFFCYTPFSGVYLLSGTVQTVDSTRTRVTTYSYDSGNKYVLSTMTVDPAASLSTGCAVTNESPALNLMSQYSFDSVGNISTISDPRSNATTYYFDLMRRLTRIDAPPFQAVSGNTAATTQTITRYTYDLDGERLTSRHSIVATPSDSPNADNPSLAATDWQTETRTYWPTGDLQSVRDANGHLTQYAYDPEGRVTLTTDPDGRVAATVYDMAGQTTCTFKGWNRATAPVATDCAGWSPANYTSGASPLRFAAYTYTANGLRQTVTDADGNATGYVYDGLDRLGLTLFPDPDDGSLCIPNGAAAATCARRQTYESYGYDANGNRTSLLTRKGDTLAWTYNPLNLASTKTVPGLPEVIFNYWLTKDIQSVAYQGGHSTSYDYDGAGRKAYENNDGRTVSYSYDGSGNRSTTQWPDSYVASYSYDAMNRMSLAYESNASGPLLASYDYDILGRRVNLSYAANGNNKIAYSYDAGNNLSALTNQMNAAAVSFSYLRNNSNQITTLTVDDGFYLPQPVTGNVGYAVNRLNEYTANGPVTGVDTNGKPVIKGGHGRFITVPFDDLFLVFPSVAAGTSPFDSANDPGGNTIVSDLNGNVRRWTGPDGARDVYTYDAENRLRTATTASHTVSYDYDALGRRISKSVDGVTTGYLLDGDEEIAEYNVSTTGVWPSSSARRYVTGPAVDDRIAVVDTPTDTKSYYHTNHQGSVIATTDSSGNVIQRLSYDEYGNLSSGSSTTGQAFRYTGRRYDLETGLYYYRARYYSPQLGRFLQADPVGYKDDFNLYSYVYNDALNRTDPSGESECEPTGPGSLRCTSDGFIDHAALHLWLWFNGYTVNSESHGDTDKTSSSDSDKKSDAPTSPTIVPGDLTGKTQEEIEQLAKDKGLVPDPKKPLKWRDPVTGKERLRIDPGHIDTKTGKPYDDPNAAGPHVHGYNGKIPVVDPTGNPHFPLQELPETIGPEAPEIEE